MKLSSLHKKSIAIVGILASVSAFAASPYRPTLQFETLAHIETFNAVNCKHLKEEWYHAKQLESQYQRDGQPVPDWLIEKLVYLEGEMKRFGC